MGSPEFVARAGSPGPGVTGLDDLEHGDPRPSDSAGDEPGKSALQSSHGAGARERLRRDATPTGTIGADTRGLELHRSLDGVANGNDGNGVIDGHDTNHDMDDEGPTCVLLVREGVLLARFLLADTLRTDARPLVDGLRARGIETTIASGDSPAAVERAARELGVTRHLAGLSPEDKLEEAARLAASGERVLMVGDGVNDTPALAGAHVSVAMGRGAAAAAARADAVLIGDDPGRLLAALDIARFARRIVKQNLAWALGYNLVALPLAAAGMVPPWAAAIGMSLSSLAVAGNALRLGRTRDLTGS